MRYTATLVGLLAGTAVAAPTVDVLVERGLAYPICLGLCVEVCAVNPLGCLACAALCTSTAEPDGTVDEEFVKTYTAKIMAKNQKN